MTFQKGDGQVVIAGKTYDLRLTMGALAELDTCLSVSGPQELSLRLRALSQSGGRVLLACVMRPCLPFPAADDDLRKLAATFSDADIAEAMPSICKLFEEAFSDGGL